MNYQLNMCVRAYVRVSLLCPCAHDQLNGIITISGFLLGVEYLCLIKLLINIYLQKTLSTRTC